MASLPSIVDLYAGVGGLSLGAVKAGFELKAAVELEKRASDSHSKNFPNTTHVCQDVSKLSAKLLRSHLPLPGNELAGVIGGPPCQGFSSIGYRSANDKRNQLFVHFFTLVNDLKPAFFLAENVPGILSKQYSKIRTKAFKIVEDRYEIMAPIKIRASDFGAVTTRTRIFFIGVRKDVKILEPITDSINRLKSEKSNFVKDGLHLLPISICEDWQDFHSSFQKLEEAPTNKYITSLNEIVDGIGDEINIKRFIKKNEVSGCFGTRHSPEVAKRYGDLKHGETDFISKSVRLNPDGYCPTLRAGTDSSKGSYQAVRPIHYSEARVITPREAARLQGFPDWFQFHETKWHSFRQIGNSVCPIVAEKVLAAVKASLSM